MLPENTANENSSQNDEGKHSSSTHRAVWTESKHHRQYDIQSLRTRRKEHLLMNMFVQKSNIDYVDTNRPDRLLRNHDGTKFKIKATRNRNVYKSPYYRGVQLWENLPIVTRTLQGKKEFKNSIRGVAL